MDLRNDPRVALVRERPAYSRTAPYSPSEPYPEWPHAEVSREDNPAYRGIRQLLRHLGMDAARYDTPDWNPLGTIIVPGNTVILKPNLVSHRNMGRRMYGLTDTDSLVTHGSVIRAVLDYTAKALQGRGTIIVGDCPVQGTEWQEVIALVCLDRTADYFRAAFPGIELQVHDFRLGRAIRWGNTVVKRIVDEEARADYQEVDLKRESMLLPLMQGDYAFGVSDYPRHRMRAAHTPETNNYLYPKAFLRADVMINLPKMKTHMKAGLTCAMKNFVGANGHKDYLPHFRFGSPQQGGDEFPDGSALWRLLWFFMHKAWDLEGGKMKLAYIALARVCALLLRFVPNTPRPVWALGSGSWYGNDTLWRMVLDINRAYFYCDPVTMQVDRTFSTKRRYLAILDGLIGGQRESPLAPTPIESGLLLAAHNPLALDTVAASLMGFDYRKIPQLFQGYAPHALPLAHFGPEAIRILGETPFCGLEDLTRTRDFTPFEASKGFRGHIERDNSAK
ncbi:MAG TPA: DUF362 domain-containing protein [Chthonomonadaceae bacterium]|nr:DUF362 domain-containing protein [Chthonomonadaceae bacterium]